MLQKRQQVQMERLQKDNHFEKTNELKTLTHDHTNNPWSVSRIVFVFVHERRRFCFYTCMSIVSMCRCFSVPNINAFFFKTIVMMSIVIFQ